MPTWKDFWAFVQSLPYLTQATHFFAGMAVVLAAALWLEPLWAGGLFVVLFAAPKECLVDNYKWGEGHGSPDWIDLAFYCLGDAFALFLLHLGGR